MSISRSRSRKKSRLVRNTQEEQEVVKNMKSTKYLYLGYFVLGSILFVSCFFFIGLFLNNKEKEESVVTNFYEVINNNQNNTQELILASWSDKRLNGNITASGEIFDSSSFTAAHSNLPFGSEVILTNPENGHMIKVRINDRSTVDLLILSERAAQALDLKADKQEVIIQFSLSNN